MMLNSNNNLSMMLVILILFLAQCASSARVTCKKCLEMYEVTKSKAHSIKCKGLPRTGRVVVIEGLERNKHLNGSIGSVLGLGRKAGDVCVKMVSGEIRNFETGNLRKTTQLMIEILDKKLRADLRAMYKWYASRRKGAEFSIDHTDRLFTVRLPGQSIHDVIKIAIEQYNSAKKVYDDAKSKEDIIKAANMIKMFQDRYMD